MMTMTWMICWRVADALVRYVILLLMIPGLRCAPKTYHVNN